MPEISVDNEVMERLRAEAVQRKLVFWNPQRCLARHPPDHSESTINPPDARSTGGISPTLDLLLDELIVNFVKTFNQQSGDRLGFAGGQWASFTTIYLKSC